MTEKIFNTVNGLIKQTKEKYAGYKKVCNNSDSSIKRELIFINLRRILPFCLICNVILLLYLGACSLTLKVDPTRLSFLIATILYFITNIIFGVLSIIIDNKELTNLAKVKQLTLLFYLFTFTFLLTLSTLEIYHYQTFHNLFILCCVISFLTTISFKFISLSLLIAIVVSFFALNLSVTYMQLIAILVPIILAIAVSQLLKFNNKKYLIASQKVNIKNEELELKLKTDYLTKAYNRYGLETHTNLLLPYAVRSKTPISIIMIDIDFFKAFNDSFGHLEGDICLAKIAGAISNSVKSDADLVCRFGGEEFLIFCYNVTKEETIKIAIRIKRAIKNLCIKSARSDVSELVTVSMGISNTILERREQYKCLIKKADKELYKAKEDGRNMIFLDDKKVG